RRLGGLGPRVSAGFSHHVCAATFPRPSHGHRPGGRPGGGARRNPSLARGSTAKRQPDYTQNPRPYLSNFSRRSSPVAWPRNFPRGRTAWVYPGAAAAGAPVAGYQYAATLHRTTEAVHLRQPSEEEGNHV